MTPVGVTGWMPFCSRRRGTPIVESFRKSTRGFIELASVSHLGTAVAWLVRLRELNDPIWHTDARRLIDQLDRTRRVNTEELWRNAIAVPPWAGTNRKSPTWSTIVAPSQNHFCSRAWPTNH